MSDERPKPSDDLVKWFKEATERITALDKQIDELVSKDASFWKYSFSLVNPAENRELFLDNQDAAKKEHSRVKEKIRSKRQQVDFLRDLQNQTGICPQCGGYGKFDRFESLRSGSILNQPIPRCDQCWGSGWKEGNENPFNSITHAIMEKLD